MEDLVLLRLTFLIDLLEPSGYRNSLYRNKLVVSKCFLHVAFNIFYSLFIRLI